MTLQAGQTVSFYEVLGSLGAGSMGEVYRARDTRLGRDVAIKVLPEAFVEDDERLARFEREARTLASLNHPNIAGIHAVEQVDDLCFLALELVPGDDLSERLERGPLALDEAIDVCRQLAEGLEAAHASGVVHRDLKPANVRVTPEGGVKVLDFGLAKPVASAARGELTTQDGTILGTPTYMSPEQARGRPVDARADVWAFGCILYECLTGRPPFGGETVADVLVAVTEKAPDWSQLPRKTPAGVRRVLERCLTKDVRSRLQHVGEARIVLEAPDAGAPVRTVAPGAPTSPVWARGLVTAIVAVVAYMVGSHLSTKESPRSSTRLTVEIPSELRLELPNPRSGSLGGVAPPLAMAPDGSALVYLARSENGPARLYLRPLDQFEATPLPGTERAEAPFFSPDGAWVGFFRDSALYKLPIGGGAPLHVLTVPVFERPSATWGEDDVIVFTRGVNAAGRLERVAATGGPSTYLTVPDFAKGEIWHGMPQFLSRRTILFTVASRSGLSAALLDVESGAWHPVEGTGDAAGARFLAGHDSAPGMLVYAQAGRLLAAAFDDRSGVLKDIPRPVLDAVSSSALGLGHWDCARNGTLAYVPGDVAETALVLVDRSGEVTWRAPELGAYQHPRLSPDGESLLYDSIGSDGRDIWRYELLRGGSRRLTTEATNLDPLWVPGTDQIVFSRFIDAVRFLHVLDIGKVGARPRKLLEGASNQIGGTWSQSGDLLFTKFGERAEDIWILSEFDEPRARALLEGPGRQGWPTLSTDGRFLAYVSDESGMDEIYACTYPDLTGKQPISRGGGSEPLWSWDGTELFYRQGRDFLAVSVVASDGRLEVGETVRLFGGSYDRSPTGHQHYDVSREGQRFALVENLYEIPNTIRVILDWRPADEAAAREPR